jgi:hypothetical protein
MFQRPNLLLAWLVALTFPAPALSAEDAEVGAPPFAEGDVITYDKAGLIEPHVPPEFWANRDFFFYPGMYLEIGPFFRDYGPAPEYEEATRRFSGRVRLGPDGSLDNFVAGQPFPMEEIDCQNDPQAGVKIMWNFDYQWAGTGGQVSFYYSYWDRGEELPLYYQGTSKHLFLTHLVDQEKYNGDLFRGEKRKHAFGIDVAAPFDARGIAVMTYRYKSSDGPRQKAKNDDTWVYLPQLRRVRRISLAQRTDAVSGTDFTFDDLRTFSGIIPQYDWTCLGEMDLLAPMNSRIRAYPYAKDHNFGPYGLSYADDRWEMRRAIKVRMTPKDADHPYHHKDIYIDKQAVTALYSFAYDQKQELWKIIWHNHRWSEDDPNWYPGWKGVPKPLDQRIVSDTIANVQTGTGNRIDFWDNHGAPMKTKGKIRRYIDIGRLTKGR